MRKILRILMWTVAAILLIASITAAILYRAWRHEPDFYVAALEAPSVEHEVAGDQLEKRVLDLRNELRREGEWEAVFTDEQINGWLAVDLPEKFGDSLPKSIKAPRVAIESDRLRLAFRYDDGGVTTVLSLEFGVHLTEEPNVVAIRLRKARAGSLPLPLNRVISQISNAAKHSEWELRWAQEDGDPVALVRIPVEHKSYENKQLKLNSVELGDKEIRITGQAGREVAAAFFSDSTLKDHFPAPEQRRAKWTPQDEPAGVKVISP